MAFNVGKSIQTNGVLPPFAALDSLPFADVDLANDFAIADDGIAPLSPSRAAALSGVALGRRPLIIVTSRVPAAAK
jgi:hypothetical protein